MSYSDFSSLPCVTSAEYGQPAGGYMAYSWYERNPCDQVLQEIDDTVKSQWFLKAQVTKGDRVIQYGNLSPLSYGELLECAMKSRNPAEFQQCEKGLGSSFSSKLDRKEAIDACSREFQSPCVAPEFSILKKITGSFDRQQSSFIHCQKTDPQELKMRACREAALRKPYKLDTFSLDE